MPVSPRQEFITPFADEAMRLLRENWSGGQGTKMLSEELFAILQQKIPLNRSGPVSINLLYGTDQAAFTIRQNGDGDFASFVNKFGQQVGAIDADGNFKRTKSADRRPGTPSSSTTRQTPIIVWATPADITDGTPLSSTQLNAVANDPISGYELDGTYTYTPPSGTVLSAGDDQALSVVFTPSNTNGYRRARKTVTINVTGGIEFVQSIATGYPSSTSSHTLNFSTDVTDGNLILVAIATYGGGSLNTVSDSQGNTYTLIRHNLSLDVYYTFATADGPLSVTYQPDQAAFGGFAICEFSGVGSLDSSVAQLGGIETDWTTGSIPVNNPGSLIVGVFTQGDDSVNAIPGVDVEDWAANPDGVGQASIYVLGKIGVDAADEVTASSDQGPVDYQGIGISFSP